MFSKRYPSSRNCWLGPAPYFDPSIFFSYFSIDSMFNPPASFLLVNIWHRICHTRIRHVINPTWCDFSADSQPIRSFLGPSDYPIGWSLLDGLQNDFNHSNPPKKMLNRLDTWKFRRNYHRTTILETFFCIFFGVAIPKVKQKSLYI